MTSSAADGFRVLALAYRDLDPKPAYSKEDEGDLILRGYVAFLDPPKDTAAAAIAALHEHGISVKVLTGDNELVSRKICREVGIATEQVLLGSQVEGMSDAELAGPGGQDHPVRPPVPGPQAAHHQGPARGGARRGVPGRRHQRRAGPARRRRGHFGGHGGRYRQGIGGRHPAGKDLLVLEEGVLSGRKVFANILKYIRMGASSNFGNMFSVVGASIFLPFVPMAPLQILTNNLLYDFSQVPIPTDDVDPEQIARPRPWSMNAISRFILFIGPCSSVFDYTTFFIMLYVFDCWDPANASLFQTGWFVESLLTQTLIIHVIRTNRFPFLQSWASWPLIVTTAVIMMVGAWLPFSPIAAYWASSPCLPFIGPWWP